MSKSFALCAKAAVRLLCSALPLLGSPERGQAVTITNYLDAAFRLYSLAVNVGDTVMWINQQPAFDGTNFVESYGGEWKSPQLLLVGDSFSFTFTNRGFFAYRTGVAGSFSDLGAFRAGAVTVSAWTGGPPAVTINTPVDGSVVMIGTWLQASVSNVETVAEIQYFANSNLIGSATNPPYGIAWATGFQAPAPYVLVAKAIDRQGGVAWSPPVQLFAEKPLHLWGTRLLPTGELLFFYNGSAPEHLWIGSSDNPFLTQPTLLLALLTRGALVDETVRSARLPAKFYGVIVGP